MWTPAPISTAWSPIQARLVDMYTTYRASAPDAKMSGQMLLFIGSLFLSVWLRNLKGKLFSWSLALQKFDWRLVGRRCSKSLLTGKNKRQDWKPSFLEIIVYAKRVKFFKEKYLIWFLRWLQPISFTLNAWEAPLGCAPSGPHTNGFTLSVPAPSPSPPRPSPCPHSPSLSPLPSLSLPPSPIWRSLSAHSQDETTSSWMSKGCRSIMDQWS